MNIERLVAPAKLTLSLRITGVRADGYHLIDAVMTTLALHDEITVEEITAEADHDDTELEFDGPFSDGIPTDATNLSFTANLSTPFSRVRFDRCADFGSR